MPTLKLQFGDIEEDDYSLIAVHTMLPCFRLAFFLNQQLNLRLVKSKEDHFLQKDKMEVGFTHFIFEDHKKQLNWKLIENKKEIVVEKTLPSFNLFNEIKDESRQHFLISEHKKADFFVKIEGEADLNQKKKWVSKISEVTKIHSAYLLNQDNLKTKNNLIF